MLGGWSDGETVEASPLDLNITHLHTPRSTGATHMARAINAHQYSQHFDAPAFLTDLAASDEEYMDRIRKAEGLESDESSVLGDDNTGYLSPEARHALEDAAIAKQEARQQNAAWLQYLAQPPELAYPWRVVQ